MPSGGKRVGAGRKPPPVPMKPQWIRLTEAQAKLLRQWGRGDVSAGLRWLIDCAEKVVKKIEKPPNND